MTRDVPQQLVGEYFWGFPAVLLAFAVVAFVVGFVVRVKDKWK